MEEDRAPLVEGDAATATTPVDPPPYQGSGVTQPAPPSYGPVVPPPVPNSYTSASNTTNVTVVTNQPMLGFVTAPPLPETYMVWSILTFFCCFWPVGLAAIIYSARVTSEYNAGRYESAQRASRTAKGLNFTALGVGIAFFIFIGVSFGIRMALVSTQR